MHIPLNHKLYFFLTVIILCSCKNERDFEDNKIYNVPVFKVSQNDIDFSVSKVPNDYLFSNAHLKSDIEAHVFNDVFIFELKGGDNIDLLKDKSTVPYDDVIRHMSQNIYEDFIAYTKDGTPVKCVGIVNERTFSVRPQERLILHFERANSKEISKIIYTDRLFGSGSVTFNLSNYPIKS